MDILAATHTVSKTFSTGEIIGGIFLVVLITFFFLLWKKMLKNESWVTALIFVLLPFIMGILTGAYGTVARELFKLTSGKIGF
jgi:hypothetical protein